jgi:hypothetical protein
VAIVISGVQEIAVVTSDRRRMLISPGPGT